MRNTNESGIAMITVLLVLMLMSALLVGFTTVVISDQRYRFIDRDRNQAFYAASAGVEKLTADLGNLFLENVAPTRVQITALTVAAKMPSIPGITFAAPAAPAALPASQLTAYHCIGRDPITNAVNNTKAPTNPPIGTPGYTIMFCALNATGNPIVTDDPLVISGTGPYSGMTALQTPYQIDVTAKTSTGGEVHLIRTMQAVAIPVFQFGMFSDADLSFFAGAAFSFGGRVHTNGNLFLAEGNGATLQLLGRVTAVRDVVRQFLSNGATIAANGSTGTVSLATSAAAPAGNRNLLATEGSVVGAPGSAPVAGWQTLSLGATPTNYNGFLKNTATGAKQLSLPLTAPGVSGCAVPGANTPPAAVLAPCTNVEIVRRPLAGEDANGILYNERLFTKASIRILLSDTAADIANIPGVTADAPVPLDGNWNVALPVAGYGPITLSSGAAAAVNVNRPPVALSPGPLTATTNGVAGALTFATNAAAAPFLPKYTFAGFPNNIITCTGKITGNPYQLTGCTGVPAMPATAAGTVLSAVSPASPLGGAGASSGASAATSALTTAASTTISFVNAATVNVFSPMPFWDTGTNRLVTCTGFTGTPAQAANSYRGCSFIPNPPAILSSAAMSDPGVGTLGGYIKIERQNVNSTIAAPSWTDVTLEILNYGIGDANSGGTVCADPTINAIVRLQRLRDNTGGGCTYNTDATGAKDPTNWWPLVLFDAREGLQRDWDYPNPATAKPPTVASDANDPRYLTLGGVMHYVNIDVLNLQRWFRHNTAPFNVPASTGNLSKIDGTGFSVYFSDRRNNRNAALRETGEYGWEDFVNPASANGVPNGVLDTGEDVNGNGVLETYGGIPNYTPMAGVPANVAPPCVGPPTCTAVYGAAAQPASTGYVLNANARPTWAVPSRVAQVNRAILFRRALMLSRGNQIATTPVVNDRLTGLTIVSENPVYVEGNWNAEFPAGTGFGGANAATSIIADAVTLLSSQWTDASTFLFPYDRANRPQAGGVTVNSWYRVAILGGKGISFPFTGAPSAADYGTDGGAHNFLRYLEDLGGQTVNYLGSLASLYYNRQAVGTYKYGDTVYQAPGRAYNFDQNFLTPALLPPLTPMFRDLNVIGFSQELRPGK